MFELMLYDLSTSWLFIATFLILLFFIGIAIYMVTKDFKLKDGKIKVYGLLLGFRNIDVIYISMIIVRTFIIIYSLVVFNKNVTMYLIMIAMISIIFIFSYLKNIFYEIINTGALMAIVYFANQLNEYLIHIEESNSIKIIKLILICFGVLYTMYIFFREFEDIVTEHENINE